MVGFFNAKWESSRVEFQLSCRSSLQPKSWISVWMSLSVDKRLGEVSLSCFYELIAGSEPKYRLPCPVWSHAHVQPASPVWSHPHVQAALPSLESHTCTGRPAQSPVMHKYRLPCPVSSHAHVQAALPSLESHTSTGCMHVYRLPCPVGSQAHVQAASPVWSHAHVQAALRSLESLSDSGVRVMSMMTSTTLFIAYLKMREP